ncbi:alpha/beta hydrolase [Kribbella sp. NPDC058245]|uniref:alpha/beta hydrolase n=1 Tax=Kribbella sp. NPDC058245 TaxID=3346399 RepID=UPI0036EC6C88
MAIRTRRKIILVAVLALLAALLGAGVAAATVPCSFPTPPAPGLISDGVGTLPATPSGAVTASDGVQLAYYAELPAHPTSTLVFFHGSGANSRAGYLPLARQLVRYGVATYLVDIRGHGASGGPRGDAPSPQQVWQDTADVIGFVHDRWPGLPEFAGGHSAGAGLILNSLNRFPDPIAGYVFLAPDYGLHSDTEKVDRGSNFATICTRIFIANAVTGGRIDGHTKALGFAYTTAELRESGMVNRYTVNMALAQNADQAADDLQSIKVPVGVWVGADDEVFDATKLAEFSRQAPHADVTILPGETHLSLLDTSAAQVGPWMQRQSASGR